MYKRYEANLSVTIDTNESLMQPAKLQSNKAKPHFSTAQQR